MKFLDESFQVYFKFEGKSCHIFEVVTNHLQKTPHPTGLRANHFSKQPTTLTALKSQKLQKLISRFRREIFASFKLSTASRCFSSPPQLNLHDIIPESFSGCVAVIDICYEENSISCFLLRSHRHKYFFSSLPRSPSSLHCKLFMIYRPRTLERCASISSTVHSRFH